MSAMISSTDVEISFNAPFTSTYRSTEHDPIKASADALALSCCAHRLSKLQQHYSFTSPDLVEKLLPEDYVLATDIKHYYGKKIMWARLNGKDVSKFRNDLFTFIHSEDPNMYTDATCGMIHKIPDFYEEDKILETMKAQSDQLFVDEKIMSSRRTLMPLNVIQRRSNRIKSNNYWLRDVDTNRLCELVIPIPNPLETLWVDMFNNCATITMNARYTHRRRDDFNFYQITNWTLENQKNA